MHIEKDHESYPQLFVHKIKIKEAEKEKYLDDIIDSTISLNSTLEGRKNNVIV